MFIIRFNKNRYRNVKRKKKKIMKKTTYFFVRCSRLFTWNKLKFLEIIFFYCNFLFIAGIKSTSTILHTSSLTFLECCFYLFAISYFIDDNNNSSFFFLCPTLSSKTCTYWQNEKHDNRTKTQLCSQLTSFQF